MKTDILKFGVVGGLSTAIDFLLLNFFTRLGLNVFWAIFFSYLIGAVNGYLLNNHWTYSHLRKRATLGGYASYAAISLVGLGLTEIIVLALSVKLHTGLNFNKLVAVATVFLWNFLANRLLTFRPAPDKEKAPAL